MSAHHTSDFRHQFMRSLPGSLFAQRDMSDSQPTDKYERVVVFERTSAGHVVGSFSFSALPGCCGVLLVYNLQPGNKKLFPKFRKVLIECLPQAARRSRFGLIMLTLKEDSSLADMEGFTGCAFINGKTKHKLVLLTHQVPYDEPRPSRTVWEEVQGE